MFVSRLLARTANDRLQSDCFRAIKGESRHSIDLRRLAMVISCSRQPASCPGRVFGGHQAAQRKETHDLLAAVSERMGLGAVQQIPIMLDQY